MIILVTKNDRLRYQAFFCQFWENAIFFNWEIKREMIFYLENK